MLIDEDVYSNIAISIILISILFPIAYSVNSYQKSKKESNKKTSKLIKLFEILFMAFIYLPTLCVSAIAGCYVIYILFFVGLKIIIEIFTILFLFFSVIFHFFV